MPHDSRGEILRHLRRLVRPENEDDASDGQLLELFAAERAEAAFAALVRRHGPMVLGVCRRVLGNLHDAEDAFQATFLVLQRRAGSLEGRATVGNWLYTVAYHVALRARAGAARRREQERQAVIETRPEDRDEAGDRDLRQVIDEELARLPEKYRAPVVLCYLEGKSNEEAARLLGWSLRSVTGRLARARGALHKRLARRSLAFSVAWLATATAQNSVSAALCAATVRTATLCAVGEVAAAGLVSPTVTHLAEGALKAMVLHQWKLASALAAVLMLATGSGFLLHQALAEKPATPPNAATPTAARADQAELPGLPVAFARTLELIKPQANESRYAQVPWAETLWDARVKAAAEGKPIFIWVTGGPPGIC